MSLAYLYMNLDSIRERECGPIVNAENVCLGRRVQWGKHWSKKWRDNISAKKRVNGTIIGYVDRIRTRWGEFRA